MTKLNYVNRKSEGVKLGEIVAKDLRKRAKHAAFPVSHKESPIELLLDNKHLTDRGLAEAARGLEEALELARSEGKPTVSVISLSRNALTCRSLYELAPSVRLSKDDLLELDLSANAISMDSRDDVRNLTTFLDALGTCHALRVLNLSGNNLSGSRFWETFAQAYDNQFQANDETLERMTDEMDGAGVEVASIEPSFDALTLHVAPPATQSSSDNQIHHLQGLPSISCINLADVSLTDAGALWLSFCLNRHVWIHNCLKARQRSLDSANCKVGFVWTPNTKLSSVGTKALKEAEAAPFDQTGNTPWVPENSPTGRNTSIDAGMPRRISGANQRVVEYSIFHRRRSSFGIAEEDQSLAIVGGLESTRRKLQRTILEETGPQIVDLWRTSLKLLTYIRKLLPHREAPLDTTPALSDQRSVSDSPELVRDSLPRTPTPKQEQQTYASKLVIQNAEKFGTGVSSPPGTPQVFRHPRRRHENVSFHSDSSSPQSTMNGHARAAIVKAAMHMTQADVEITGRIPVTAWIRILRLLCDPDGVLCQRQVDGITSWARNRRTLAIEADGLGKSDSVQIWRVLEGMGCLSYDD